MLETRTHCLYDLPSVLLCVHRFFNHVEASCTARAPSLEGWTQRIWHRFLKYLYFTVTYLGWTDWTAISGFFYTRVRVCGCIDQHKILFIYASSRHINPRIICPICPSVEIVDKNTFLSVLLHVQSLSFDVLAVQQLYFIYKSLLNLVLTSGFSRKKSCILQHSCCVSEFFRFIKADLKKRNDGQARLAYPPVKGPYKHLHYPRAGATPIFSQSNGLEVWVNAVNGVNAWLLGVNGTGRSTLLGCGAKVAAAHG